MITRSYPDYQTMITEEASRRDRCADAINCVSVVTPNDTHVEPVRCAIENGFPVVCEKPFTMTVEEAKGLEQLASTHGIPVMIFHTYLGHWTSLIMRHMVETGVIGDLISVHAFYLQGWLADTTMTKETIWRLDPKRVGLSCCGGDIGTHALAQLMFVTDMTVNAVQARMPTLVDCGRREVDDHFEATCVLGASLRATIRASQVTRGHHNDLGIQVVGTKGTLEWRQEDAEVVHLLRNDQGITFHRGALSAGHHPYLGTVPQELIDEYQLPSGHVEGLYGAAAGLYRRFFQTIESYRQGVIPVGKSYPDIGYGVEGMRFLTAARESDRENNAWVLIER